MIRLRLLSKYVSIVWTTRISLMSTRFCSRTDVSTFVSLGLHILFLEELNFLTSCSIFLSRPPSCRPRGRIAKSIFEDSCWSGDIPVIVVRVSELWGISDTILLYESSWKTSAFSRFSTEAEFRRLKIRRSSTNISLTCNSFWTESRRLPQEIVDLDNDMLLDVLRRSFESKQSTCADWSVAIVMDWNSPL